jgi:exodeoxyribonuclease VIII
MILHDLSDADYHGRSELSSTGARLLLPEFGGSPAKFKYRQGREYTSTAFDVGKAVHAEVLGVGAYAVEYPVDVLATNGAASTKAAKEWADSVRFEGKIPMKAADLRPIRGMAQAVLAHPTARALFELPGHREVSVFGEVDGVPVRARFDALTEDGYGIDLKTTDDASPRAFEKSIAHWGYHLQAMWYEDTLYAATGRGLINFNFVAVEKAAPYLVGIYDMDITFRDIGSELGREARSIFKACADTGQWGGYEPQTLAAPTWLVYQHEERNEIQV